MRKYLLLPILLFSVETFMAQKTGIYDTSYNVIIAPFNNTTRKFTLKVNNNYTSSKKYALFIGLHGMGETSNIIVGDYGFLTDSMDAILICPDGMDISQSRHDNQYTGNEVNIIEESINFAKKNYNIDSNSIYIMGFSYGARISLYYGLSKKDIFRGIISVSTGYQSIADANNNLALPWSKPFNYKNGKDIPTCFCIGAADATFYPFVNQGYKNMIDSGAIVLKIESAGVGHTPLYPNYSKDIMTCLRFINQNKSVSPPQSNFINQRINSTKDSIFATNTSAGPISEYQWYVKKNTIRTNLDTGFGTNHDLRYKLSQGASFDSVCLEVGNKKGVKSTNCKYLKYTPSNAAISSLNYFNNIAIFPNPASSNVQITGLPSIENKTTIQVIDLIGRIIQTNHFQETNPIIKLNDRISDGLYILEIKMNDYILRQKFEIKRSN